MCWPPLMLRVEPVTKPASSPHRQRTPRAAPSASPRSAALCEGILVHVLAAVDAQGRAGDEAGILAAQEEDAAGDLLRLAEAADRNAGTHLGEQFLRNRR